MTTSVTGATASSGSAAAKASQQAAFGNADFLSIMLSEITNQDPLNPSDTSKMVESMRQLQVLANTANEKFRADVSWAQQMVGSMVNVTQVVATPEQQKEMKDAGLNPDIGYGNRDIRVEGFRVIDQTVWIQAEDGKQYPIDNLKQVLNDRFDTDALAEVSNRLLGMRVSYLSGTDGKTRKEGIVTGAGYDSEGKINLSVNGGYIRYDDIIAITVPSS